MPGWGFRKEGTQSATGAASAEIAYKDGYQPSPAGQGFGQAMKEKRNVIATSKGWVRREVRGSRIIDEVLVAAGDSIIIGEKSDLINVTGNVRNPGVYQYIKGKNLNYYIKNAGGVNRDGSIYEITLIHPDGKTKNVNPFYFSYIKLNP